MASGTKKHGSPSARRGGMRILAATLPAVARRALGQRGFAEGGLIAEWPSIVGEAIATRCHPTRARPVRTGRNSEGTVTLRVEPGFALELQHLEPQIIERINGHYGYAAITRLILHQGPLGAPRRPRPLPPRPLSAAEEAELRQRVAPVEDDALRGALERLGRAMRRRI